MNIRKLLITLISANLFLSLSGCAPTTSQDPNAPAALRVGVSGDNAPLIYKAGGRDFAGAEADFAKMLGQELGREVKFVSMPFDRLLPAVQRGEVDIVMSGLTVIAQRKTLVDFTDPYMNSGQAILVPTASGTLFDDPRLIFISPYRIGVEEASVGSLLAQRTHQNSVTVPYSTPTKAANALAKGKVDIVIHDAPVLWRITADNPSAPYKVVPNLISRESLAWAVRRGDTNLRKQANAALAKWRKNGTLDGILRTHMPRYDMIQ
ncbi:MAG: substrate-binding periplasmic protein [Akkermansiaceae bacterium]